MVSISMKQLLEAGVHFGHQTKRWNPKMKDFIFGERNGIYIIDLQKSLRLFKNAVQFVFDLSSQGKAVLFLGTKRQAQEVIQEEARRCGMYFVNQRWLGGLLTNFTTIQKSLKRFRELETMQTDGQYDLLSKKEVARLERERKKLEKNLSGIKDMTQLPDALFVIDTKKEAIAVQEARKLGIPIVGVADTNCDPDEIDYIIPGNDDALRAIRLIAGTIAQAIMDGRAVFEAQQKELAEQLEKQRQLQAQQAAAAREIAARAAAADAARRAAEGKGSADAPQASGEGAEPQAEAGGKPKTTLKKTLQRKARPRKSEPRTRMDSVPSPESAVQAEPAEHAAPEEASPVAAPDPIAAPEEASPVAAPDPIAAPDAKEIDPESSTPGDSGQ